jgi:hypothetical protein
MSKNESTRELASSKRAASNGSKRNAKSGKFAAQNKSRTTTAKSANEATLKAWAKTYKNRTRRVS